MSDEQDNKLDPQYGQLKKIIQFKDTEHRHAELIIRLKHDGLTQSKFFRALITLYLEHDPRFLEVVEHIKILHSKQGAKRRKDSSRLIKEGKENAQKFALDEDTRENIFDILERDFTDL